MTPIQALIVGKNPEPLIDFNQQGMLHRSIYNDFEMLVSAAKKDGIDLTIASAYRNFDRQQLIWNNKANGLRAIKDQENQVIDPSNYSDKQLLNYILHWSALPGASRHHWGTDIDVYDPSMLTDELQLEPWEYQTGGPMERLGMWLDENLSTYGFFRPYETYNNGVAAEPWHISHIEQSAVLFEQLNVELLKQVIIENDIGLKETVLANLDSIFNQYITNIVSYEGKT